MKVLLLSPPYLPNYMRNARCDYVSLARAQWYPVWLSYCGAVLEKYGHQVYLIDAPASCLTSRQVVAEVEKFSPQLMVIYSATKSEASDLILVAELKKNRERKAVFAGPFVSLAPFALLEKSPVVDYAVKGEFEYPVLELANGESPEKISNLIYRQDEQVKENKPRPLLTTKQLDSLPFVTDFYRRHLNLHHYHIPQQLFPFVDFFTGRGCIWGQCSFCLWVHAFIPGSVYNKRSIDNVMEEVIFIRRYLPQVKEIFLQDDTLPRDRAREFSEVLLQRNIKITWSCYVRGDVEYETMALMRRAGCRTVHVGYETVNEEALRKARKGLTPEEMTHFTAEAKRAGLRIHGDFVIGLGEETVDTVRATIEWAKQLNPDTAQFSLLNIYPHTPFYGYLVRNGFIKGNEPSYPHLSREELHYWAKRAYREFYLRWRYLGKLLRHPYGSLLVHWQSVLAVVRYLFKGMSFLRKQESRRYNKPG